MWAGWRPDHDSSFGCLGKLAGGMFSSMGDPGVYKAARWFKKPFGQRQRRWGELVERRTTSDAAIRIR